MEIVNQTRPVVEIYGTKVCPYCVQAKRLVGQKDWELKEYKVDERTELREEMEKRAGQPVRTVPQIFVNGGYVGGYTDFVEFLDHTELV
jgi:glutaredoxin 3